MTPPPWFFFAAVCALCYSFEGAWIKRLGSRGYGTIFLAWCTVTIATPFLWIGFLTDPPGSVSAAFYFPFTMTVLLNSVALVCYFRSFAFGELSLSFPLLALSPVWMLATTQAITGEFPSHRALAGIVLITGGCYGLGLKGRDLLSPFKNIFKNRGSRYALLTSVLWSFSANFDKAAVEASSRFFHPALHGTILSGILFTLAWQTERTSFGKLRTRAGLWPVVLLGAVVAVMVLSQFTAIDQAQSTYVIAVKRAGMVPGVLIGWKLFGEDFGPKRFAMSLVVFAGLLLML